MGRSLCIAAPSNSASNVYIAGASLNGASYTRNYLKYSDIIRGGQFDLEMSSTPTLTRGIAPSDHPFSLTPSK